MVIDNMSDIQPYIYQSLQLLQSKDILMRLVITFIMKTFIHLLICPSICPFAHRPFIDPSIHPSKKLTSFSVPSLLVKAASLKQIIQTALSFTTVSAKGIKFNTEPNG